MLKRFLIAILLVTVLVASFLLGSCASSRSTAEAAISNTDFTFSQTGLEEDEPMTFSPLYTYIMTDKETGREYIMITDSINRMCITPRLAAEE